jgi:ketosteroid isomerase-like protein
MPRGQANDFPFEFLGGAHARGLARLAKLRSPKSGHDDLSPSHTIDEIARPGGQVRRISEQNVEIVRAYFEGREKKGREGIFDFLAPDVVWEVRPDLPDAATYVGIEGVQALVARFREVMEDIWFQPQGFILVGERVVVPLRWGGRGKGSGVVFEEQHEAWTFTVHDGAITRVTEYRSKEAALEAVGVSEQDAHVESS